MMFYASDSVDEIFCLPLHLPRSLPLALHRQKGRSRAAARPAVTTATYAIGNR